MSAKKTAEGREGWQARWRHRRSVQRPCSLDQRRDGVMQATLASLFYCMYEASMHICAAESAGLNCRTQHIIPPSIHGQHGAAASTLGRLHFHKIVEPAAKVLHATDRVWSHGKQSQIAQNRAGTSSKARGADEMPRAEPRKAGAEQAGRKGISEHSIQIMHEGTHTVG